MLNPMILQPNPSDKRKQDRAASQEFSGQFYGHSLDTSAPRPSMGLLVGRLLIRMGEKLTGQDQEFNHIRENA